MVEKIYYIFIIYIYILVVFLMNYLLTNKKNNPKEKNKIDISKKEPALSLYCYSSNNINRLFWITLMDLIEKGYYELYKEKDILYIKYMKKCLNIEKLRGFEKKVISYINSVIDKENGDNSITANRLSILLTTDWNYTSNLASFGNELKQEVLKEFGIKETFKSFILPILLTYIYALQVFYYIDFNFNFSMIIFLSIPFTFLSLLIADNFKNKVPNLTKNKAIKFFTLSFILSVISFYVWQVTSDSDYIMIHLVLGFLTFIYPLLIIVDIDLIKTSNYKYNINEKNVINQMVELKKQLFEEDKLTINDYIYSLGLNLKKNCSNDLYNEFKNIMDV